jgi:hypothetical protein
MIFCKRCGDFAITGSLLASYANVEGKNHLFSGLFRWRKEKGLKSEEILTSDTIKDVLQSTEIPQNIPEKIDKLIYYVGLSSPTFGASVPILPEDDYPLTFSPFADELREILLFLEADKLIEPAVDDTGNVITIREQLSYEGIVQCKFTMQGWKRFYELERKGVDSKQCFVAMNFDDEFDSAYKKISEAVESCGFKAYRTKGFSIEDVNDLIIAGIKESVFVVADFTGQKLGVYFEAGFARGLGKRVIWTCREDEKDKLHFDTRQFNHILWKDVEELKSKLQASIRANII